MGLRLKSILRFTLPRLPAGVCWSRSERRILMDALELQIASALQRYTALQRRATEERSDQSKLFGRALKELEGALEELRVAQEQLIESRNRMEQLQADLTQQYQKYWTLFDLLPQPCIVTRSDSTIVEANKAASELFNVSQRFLI